MRIGNVRDSLTRHRGVTGFAVGVVAMASLTGGGMALAAIPDAGSGTIHGCYKKSSGALRVVDKAKGQHCTSSERKLNWNQRGINWRARTQRRRSTPCMTQSPLVAPATSR